MKLNFADFTDPSQVPSQRTQQPQQQRPQNPAQEASMKAQFKTPNPNDFAIPQQHSIASSAVTDAQFVRVNRTPSNFYIPGKSPGQPHKESIYRYCYNITKKAGKQANQFGDKFDYFLYQADKKINYYESKLIEHNPYNPFKLEVEFKVNVVDEGQFNEMKELLKGKYGVKSDDILAIEGCINDDKTVLGGKNEFFSHFCTFFNFNICYSNKENKALKKTVDMFNDHEALNKKVDDFIKKFDEMQ